MRQAIKILILVIFASYSLIAWSWEYELGASIKYFDPTEEVYREFYGSSPMVGISAHFWQKQGFGFLLDLNYFNAQRTYMGDKFMVEGYGLWGGLAYYLRGIKHLIPYLTFGISLTYAIERDLKHQNSVDDFELGYMAGAGVEFSLAYVHPYFQINFRSVPGEDQGINLSGWITELGVQIPLPLKKQRSNRSQQGTG